MSDAKLPDAQAGYEKGAAISLAAHAGANMVYETCGMYGSLLGCSFEGMVIDNDMLGAINRTVRGIEVTDETIGIETMREVTSGAQHYLGSDQTMSLMQSHYIYPEIGDRTSPKEWGELGKPKLLDVARKKLHATLSSHYPQHLSPELDAQIRAEHTIHLDTALMTVSDRWTTEN